MGGRGIKEIGDLIRFDLDLGIQCRRCGRTAVYLPAKATVYLIHHQFRTTLPLGRHPFRCRCGSREVRDVGVPVAKRPTLLPAEGPVLRPLYVAPPDAKNRF